MEMIIIITCFTCGGFALGMGVGYWLAMGRK